LKKFESTNKVFAQKIEWLHDFLLFTFTNQTPDLRVLPIKPNHVIQLANVSTLLARCLAAHGRRALALKQAIKEKKCKENVKMH
jgi:hypothetical protein